MAENSLILTLETDTDLSRDEVVQDNRKSSYKCLCNRTRTSLQIPEKHASFRFSQCKRLVNFAKHASSTPK